MTDKSKELNTSISLINDKLHFKATVEENEPVSIDYTPPLGDNLGYVSFLSAGMQGSSYMFYS